MLKHLRPLLWLVFPAVVSTDTLVRKSARTLDNLQTAFNGESNDKARYLAFAKRAGEEGLGELASLFRAAAKAEEIHARNHSDVIRRMGATPALNLQPVKVSTTRENLKTAIAGEKYERDIMYPEFLEVAKRQRAAAAVCTLTYAWKGEAVHAVLYQDALDHLGKRTGESRAYAVCPECGNTLEALNILKCMICGHTKSGLIAVT